MGGEVGEMGGRERGREFERTRAGRTEGVGELGRKKGTDGREQAGMQGVRKEVS